MLEPLTFEERVALGIYQSYNNITLQGDPVVFWRLILVDWERERLLRTAKIAGRLVCAEASFVLNEARLMDEEDGMFIPRGSALDYVFGVVRQIGNRS